MMYCKQEQCPVSDKCLRHTQWDGKEKDRKGWYNFYMSQHMGETCELYLPKGGKDETA